MKMIVMKFGGSSIADAASIERVAGIVGDHLTRRPVVVVSAMGKTTRKLLQAAQLASQHRQKETLRLISELEDYHFTEARHAIPGFEDLFVHTTLRGYFEEMRDLVKGISILREFSPRSQDAMAAYGELISSAIVSAALRVRGVDSVLLDSRGFMITDETFTRATPLFDQTDEKTRSHLTPELEAGRVPVVQGYIGSTRDGATTTLGFEGSDYSAAVIGSALDAEEIQIWKDVPGLMTADPAVIPEARIVPSASFEEMAELTYFGAKLLHPSAIWPAFQSGIPVHIYNSMQPQSEGTLISETAGPESKLVTSIAFKRDMVVARVISRRVMTAPAFLNAVFDLLDKHRLSPDLTAVSQVSVAFAFSDDSGLDVLLEGMKSVGEVEVERDKASVCLVGRGIRQVPGVAGSVLSCMTDLPIDLISHGASPNSLVFVVDGTRLEEVLNRVHRRFFT
jgi:aspartate kinase